MPKQESLRVRLSSTLRQAIDIYCYRNKMSISEFMRQACEEKIQNKEKN